MLCVIHQGIISVISKYEICDLLINQNA